MKKITLNTLLRRGQPAPESMASLHALPDPEPDEPQFNYVTVQETDLEAIAENFARNILKFREYVNVTPVKCESLNLSKAAELCIVGPTGNMVSTMISLAVQVAKSDAADFMDKHMGHVIVFSAVVLVICLAFYIMANFVFVE